MGPSRALLAGRAAAPRSAHGPPRPDAESRRGAALPASQRAGHRRQSRRAAAPDARGPDAEGPARSVRSSARVQPAQPELEHVGRHPAEAGVDLAARGRSRRGAQRQSPAGAREEDRGGHPRRHRAVHPRADRPLQRRVRGPGVRRQHRPVGHRGRAHRDRPAAGRSPGCGAGSRQLRRAGHGARGAGQRRASKRPTRHATSRCR